MDERREDQRVSILGELHGEVMVFQPMAITEIGPGGAVVETAFPLHLDSLHDLRLELTDRSIVVKGRVTHCTIIDVDQELVRYRSGVQFVEPSDHVCGGNRRVRPDDQKRTARHPAGRIKACGAKRSS